MSINKCADSVQTPDAREPYASGKAKPNTLKQIGLDSIIENGNQIAHSGPEAYP